MPSIQTMPRNSYRGNLTQYAKITLSHVQPPNHTAHGIQELKRHVHRKLKACNVPQCLWGFCSKWSCDVCSKTASNNPYLEGHTPFKAVTGNTPDISSIADINFCEPVWYYDEIASFPEPKRKMARWLGEAHNTGQAMCYFILPSNGIPIARSTVVL
jgi:hypothetical protein